MVIGSFVLISSASNNLSSNLKLVPGMQQAVLRKKEICPLFKNECISFYLTLHVTPGH